VNTGSTFDCQATTCHLSSGTILGALTGSGLLSIGGYFNFQQSSVVVTNSITTFGTGPASFASVSTSTYSGAIHLSGRPSSISQTANFTGTFVVSAGPMSNLGAIVWFFKSLSNGLNVTGGVFNQLMGILNGDVAYVTGGSFIASGGGVINLPISVLGNEAFTGNSVSPYRSLTIDGISTSTISGAPIVTTLQVVGTGKLQNTGLMIVVTCVVSGSAKIVGSGRIQPFGPVAIFLASTSGSISNFISTGGSAAFISTGNTTFIGQVTLGGGIGGPSNISGGIPTFTGSITIGSSSTLYVLSGAVLPSGNTFSGTVVMMPGSTGFTGSGYIFLAASGLWQVLGSQVYPNPVNVMGGSLVVSSDNPIFTGQIKFLNLYVNTITQSGYSVTFNGDVTIQSSVTFDGPTLGTGTITNTATVGTLTFHPYVISNPVVIAGGNVAFTGPTTFQNAFSMQSGLFNQGANVLTFNGPTTFNTTGIIMGAAMKGTGVVSITGGNFSTGAASFLNNPVVVSGSNTQILIASAFSFGGSFTLLSGTFVQVCKLLHLMVRQYSIHLSNSQVPLAELVSSRSQGQRQQCLQMWLPPTSQPRELDH
jgi:hypothetical protein